MKILKEFGDPHLKLKNIIHITGTNGKGSTASYLESILTEAGFKTGKFTSPFLIECNENITISKKKISDLQLKENIIKVKNIAEKIGVYVNLFESFTIYAVLYFAKNECDYNIIEVGMGGLFDSTNLFEFNPPIVSMITNIHYDHTKYLGTTLKEIALHKCFIIKNNSICISHFQHPEIEEVLRRRCNQTKTQFFIYGKDFMGYEVINEEIIDIETERRTAIHHCEACELNKINEKYYYNHTREITHIISKIYLEFPEHWFYVNLEKSFLIPIVYPSLSGRHQLKNLSAVLFALHQV